MEDIATPTLPEPEDLTAIMVSVIVGRYGFEARALVERQIEEADGAMRQRWIDVCEALPRS